MFATAAVLALFAVAQSAASPLRGIARAAQSDLVLVDRVRSGSNVVYPNENIPITPSTNVPIGKNAMRMRKQLSSSFVREMRVFAHGFCPWELG